MLDRVKIAHMKAIEDAKEILPIGHPCKWEQISPAWRHILMSIYLSGKEDSVEQVNAMLTAPALKQ